VQLIWVLPTDLPDINDCGDKTMRHVWNSHVYGGNENIYILIDLELLSVLFTIRMSILQPKIWLSIHDSQTKYHVPILVVDPI